MRLASRSDGNATPIAVGIDRFGASAPAGDIFEALGLTAVNVASAVTDLLDAIAEY
ncbi:MAG: hypothetical protein R2706_17895 [Acidimicrobiales bacterium]